MPAHVETGLTNNLYMYHAIFTREKLV